LEAWGEFARAKPRPTLAKAQRKPEPLNPACAKPLGNVAFLVPGVRVSLRASKPEFRCEQGDPLPAQLRGRRRRLNLSVEDAAALVGVRRWTFGLWENGQQRPQARYRGAIARFLGQTP
jgi:DNA-binding XRE family transcriptional regulator